MKRKRDSEEDSHVPTRREKERNDRYAALVRDSPKIFIVYKGAMTAAKEVGEDTEDVKEEGKGKGREEGEERCQVALRVVTLPHPATGEPVRYGVAGRTLLELQQMRPVNNLGWSYSVGNPSFSLFLSSFSLRLPCRLMIASPDCFSENMSIGFNIFATILCVLRHLLCLQFSISLFFLFLFYSFFFLSFWFARLLIRIMRFIFHYM